MTFSVTETYDGSKMFLWLSNLSGLPIDLVNFLLAQAFAFFAAGVLRGPLKGAPPHVRHAICLILGLMTGYFCFGKKAIHLAVLPILCFVMMKTLPERVMANGVLGTAIAYLSCIHLHRQFYLVEACNLDITGPLMVITQRVTSVAFLVHDGREKKGDEKNTQPTRDNGGHGALPKVPSSLEYFSYAFAFQTLLCGPALTFSLYENFIHNKTHEHQLAAEPSRKSAVWGKLGGAIFAAGLHLMLAPRYPIRSLADEPPTEWSLTYLLWYCYAATLAVRCKYYLAWLLSDAVCNNAGIGYKHPDKWDDVTNVDIIGFETAETFRDAVARWNPGTGAWLRLIVYNRVKTAKLLKTYALSAVWHGFYPGYYLTFATGALFTLADRKVRSFAKPFSWSSSRLYNALAFTLTRVFMTYATVPFVLLDLAPSLALYRRVYFSLHFIAIGALLLPTHGSGERKSRINRVENNHSNGNLTIANGDAVKKNGDVKNSVTNGETLNNYESGDVVTNNQSNGKLKTL